MAFTQFVSNSYFPPLSPFYIPRLMMTIFMD